MAVSSAGPAFSSSRIVTFSDLPEEEKDAFIKFFAAQKVQFFRDADGSYVANVRLYDPNVIDMGLYQRSKQTAGGKEDSRKPEGGARGGNSSASASSSSAAGSSSAAFSTYGMYSKFTSLIAPKETGIKPKTRPLVWLMRLIEELFDARYAKDTADLKEETGEEGAAPPASVPFPTFVVDFFTKRYGLKSLIDQNCWDLLATTHAARSTLLEAEVFGRFLEGYYDSDDLLFYLYVRSIVQKETGVSFKSRWTELGRNNNNNNNNNQDQQGSPSGARNGSSSSAAGGLTPAPFLLTLKECQSVSRTVFGHESDPLYRTFMTMVERHIDSTPVPAGAAIGGTVSLRRGAATAKGRAIDASQFLHLALVEYHETREVKPGDEGGNREVDYLASALNSGLQLGGNSYNGSSSGAESDAANALIREAEAAFEARSNGSSSSSSNAGGSAAAAVEALHRNPKFFDVLGEEMQRANDNYLSDLLSRAGAGRLPAEVQSQIRTEVANQLEPKVDQILAATIKAVQTGGKTGGSSSKVSGALVNHFVRVVDATVGAGAASNAEGAAASLMSFCAAVLDQEEVRKAVESLVKLLVQYAESRLDEGGAQ